MKATSAPQDTLNSYLMLCEALGVREHGLCVHSKVAYAVTCRHFQNVGDVGDIDVVASALKLFIGFSMDQNENKREKKLREITRASLAACKDEASKQGVEGAEIIARRGSVVGCRYHVNEGASRLMPIAAGRILELDGAGRSLASGTVFWADSLHAPKGRMERRWWAPEGGIYLCIALFPELEQGLWSLYGIAAGVSIAQVMREHGIDANIRWINDILMGGRKVSGTIIETLHAPVSKEHWILVGTGVNVNMSEFPPEIKHHATSLLLETGKRWDTDKLGAEIIARFGWNVGLVHHWDAIRYLEGEDFDMGECPVVSQWRVLNSTLGRNIRFGPDLEKEPGDKGRAVDITPDGRLVVETGRGERVVMESGEVRYG